MSKRLYSTSEYAAFAALYSMIAAMIFYLFYDILEFTEVITDFRYNTAKLMYFFLMVSTLSIVITTMFPGHKRKSDVTAVVVAPYAVAVGIFSVKKHPFLFIAAMAAMIVIIALKVLFLFMRRKPTELAKKQKLRHRVAILLRFSLQTFVMCCTVVMLILFVKASGERISDAYELRKYWNSHAGQEIGAEIENTSLGIEKISI